MTVVGELAILVTGKTAQFDRSMRRSTSVAEKFGASMKRMLATAGIGATVGFGVKLAMEAEKAQLAFEVLLKSSEAATETMKELREFAAKTPFQFQDIQKGAKSLLAAQVPAAQLTKNLRMLGDIAAITDINLGDLASTFGKMKSGNLIQGEELNMLADRGLPIFQELAKVLGTSADKIRDLGSKGQITFDHLTQAFENLTGKGGAFFGATAKLADSAAGKWSTLVDNVKDGLRQLGESLMRELDMKAITADLTEFVQVMTQRLIPAITDAIKGVMSIAKGLKNTAEFVSGGTDLGANFDPLTIAGNGYVARFRKMVQDQTGIMGGVLEGVGEGKATGTLGNVLGAGQGFAKRTTTDATRAAADAAEAARKAMLDDNRMAGLRAGALNERIMGRLESGLGQLGGLLGGGLAAGSNVAGGILTPGGAAKSLSPLGLNSAVEAGSREAIALAAMAQAQHRQEAIQTDQLNAQRGMLATLQALTTVFTGDKVDKDFDTTGAL